MKIMNMRNALCGLFILSLGISYAEADVVKVAVASNFVNPMGQLKQKFEQLSDHQLLVSQASSGKHYAQIKHGAPYDIFLSADRQRPELLEQQMLAIKGSRFTYAIGRIALYGHTENLPEQQQNALLDQTVKHIAIANPRLAPYGLAAQQVLARLSAQLPSINAVIVKGENINQAYQFVVSENAQLGFVSYPQLLLSKQQNFWLIPQAMHSPIEQQAILLKESSAAREFLRFLASDAALQIIRQQGYDIP